MFQSLEYKHPKFYQVFRLFIVFFCFTFVCVESALFCQNGRPVSGRIFRIVTFTAADRVRFYPCQYTVFGV